jgi:hypothetical protein
MDVTATSEGFDVLRGGMMFLSGVGVQWFPSSRRVHAECLFARKPYLKCINAGARYWD